MTKHPMQPVEFDKNGIIRFKENKIVSFLLDNGGFNMNDIAIKDFSQEDRIQFAQLIGYSVCGFSELNYIDNKSYKKAEKLAKKLRNEIS